MIRRIGLYGILITGALIMALPFVWMVSTAFKTLPEAISGNLQLFPAQWQWHNFVDTFQAAPFARYFFNSFFVGIIVTVGVMVTSLMAGYAFARLKFPAKGLLFGLVLATMMVPFEITLIPNFVTIRRLGWYNSYAALILPWCANAFSIFLVRQSFMALPNDYYDAAKVDGCGHLRFLVRIAAPLVKPALVTVGLFAFLGSYNSLVWPLVVTSEDAMRVVQVGLTVFSGAEGSYLNLLMCASTIVIFPTVVLYFFTQQHFLDNSLNAGIKG